MRARSRIAGGLQARRCVMHGACGVGDEEEEREERRGHSSSLEYTCCLQHISQ